MFCLFFSLFDSVALLDMKLMAFGNISVALSFIFVGVSVCCLYVLGYVIVRY